jgi:hypothetical protein
MYVKGVRPRASSSRPRSVSLLVPHDDTLNMLTYIVCVYIHVGALCENTRDDVTPGPE